MKYPEFSSTSWVHNAILAWEWLFGRKKGIRLEATLTYQDGWYTRKSYTLPALLANIEGDIRSYVAETFRFILTPQPSYVMMRGAVAFGSSSNNGAITPAGSDRMLIAGIFNIASDIGAVSFGGTACNQIQTENLGVSRNGYTYMLKAPATSSNSLANVGASNYCSFYYTGVAQNDTLGTIDASQETTGTSTAPSGTLTAVSAGSWIWCSIFLNSAVTTSSAQTNMANLTRQASPSSASLDCGDTGTASGPETQSETLSLSSFWYVAQISMAPVAGTGPANLKSLDGNVKANIKSFAGNILANIKSISGNS